MRLRYFLLVLCMGLGSHLFAQSGERYFDEHYDCSFWSPVDLDRSYNYAVDTLARYTVYSGGYVSSVDTLYFRVDMWRQPELTVLERDSADMDWLMDGTLDMLSARIGMDYTYRHDADHRGYPMVLASYDLPQHRQRIKINVVRRDDVFFVFSAVALSDSHHHEWINQFLAGYLIE